MGLPSATRLEAVECRIRVELGGRVIAETTGAYRVLGTSHPPNYTCPPATSWRGRWCGPTGAPSASGRARHTTSACRRASGSSRTGLGLDVPSVGFEAIAGYLAFYAGRMDACWVGDELVVPQPGGFYGGWITSNLGGPFKGVRGSQGW